MTDATDANGIVGRLQMHPNGFGFVHVEGDAENIFIPPRRAGGALDADLVEVLSSVTFPVEQAHAHQRQPGISGRFHVVAR